MADYIANVTATVGDLNGERATEVSKYIVLMDDGSLFIEGLKHSELHRIVTKLMRLSFEQAIAAEYTIRSETAAGELYDDIQQDTNDIRDFLVSYTGQLDT